MSLQSGSLQTPVTDFNVPGILDGQVTGMDVLDPTENNEKTLLLEVDDEFDVQVCWELTGAATPVVGGSWVVSPIQQLYVCASPCPRQCAICRGSKAAS